MPHVSCTDLQLSHIDKAVRLNLIFIFYFILILAPRMAY